MMDINTVNVGELFTHLIHTLLIGYEHLRSSSHMGKGRSSCSWKKNKISAVRVSGRNFLQLGFLGKFDQRWLWSMHGPFELKFCGEFDFWRSYSLAQKSRSKGWLKLELRWLYCCCPALTFSRLRWLFWGWLWVDWIIDLRTVVTHFGLADQEDFAGWGILLTAITHQHILLFLVCLL